MAPRQRRFLKRRTKPMNSAIGKVLVCMLVSFAVLHSNATFAQTPGEGGRPFAGIPSSEIERSIYSLMLLDDSPEVVTIAARSISLFYSRDRDITDLVAERLLQGNGVGRPTAEAESWLAKVLGETHSSRYRGTLERSRQLTQSEVVKRSIDVALHSLAATTQTTAYVPGTIDLTMRRRALQSANPKPSGKASFKQGAGISQTIESAGAPDQFSVVVWNVRKHGSDPLLALHYADVGFALHRLVPGDGRRWFNVESHPQTAANPGETRDLAMAQYMLSLRGANFKEFVRSNSEYLRRENASALLVKRLSLYPEVLDRAEDEGSAYALRVIFDDRAGESDAIQTVKAIGESYSGPITKAEADKLGRRLMRGQKTKTR
jgi:hypothetical protein